MTTYDLVAAIVHHGTAGGGHYTCYALNEPSSQWFEFDDSSVRPVSADTVANCQAYVLFYQKRQSKELEDFRRHISNLIQRERETQSSNNIIADTNCVGKYCTCEFDLEKQTVASCNSTYRVSGTASLGRLPNPVRYTIRIFCVPTAVYNR